MAAHFRCSEPRELFSIQRYLKKGLAKAHNTPQSYEILALTPALQRRLGWGDARTNDAFVTALVNELHVLKWLPTFGSYALADELTQARSDLAAEEVLLRVPGLDFPRRFLTCEAPRPLPPPDAANRAG